jgi:hypothetical protein
MNPGTDWIEQGRRLLETLRSSVTEPATDAAGAEHGSDCRWCPICQAAAVLRGERPEVTAALADVLTATAAALRTFAEAVPDAPAPDAGGEAERGEEGGPPAVQQIDIA